MIPTTENSTTQTNIEGHKIAMRFDEDSLVHLMSILTDMYSDPEEAIIREYATNAYDSHVEAGQTRPIEVETPSALRPVLIIRDFGVGLNEQDIERVYSLYGASTKRETNDQVGALGIGAKSALTYTSQFTVVGTKDGIRTVVSVSRDEDGAGTMTIVEAEPTDESNGVEIVIPAKRHNEFDQKAQKLFRYWPAGSVLLNGNEPKSMDGLKLTDNISLVHRAGYYETSIVVMGNIPYEIPSEVEPMRGLFHNKRIVARVSIGDVHFAPNRERLQLTGKTKRRLEALHQEGMDALVQSIKSDVAGAASKTEALRKAIEWRQAIDRQKVSDDVNAALDSLTYQGNAVPKSLQLPQAKNERGEDYRPKFRTTNLEGKLSHSDYSTYLEARTALKAIIVTNYTADTFTPSHKKKLVAYIEQENVDGTVFALFNGQLPEDLDWFDRPIIRWEDVRAIKLDRTYVEGARKSLQGSYDVHEGYSFTHEKHAHELAGPLYYYTTDTYKNYGYRSGEKDKEALNQQADLFAKYRPDAMLIRLGLNRVPKFLRDFPHAKEAKPEIVAMYNEILSGLGKDGQEAYWMREHSQTDELELLDADLIDDPMLKRAVKLAHIDVTDAQRKLNVFFRNRLNLHLPQRSEDDVYKLTDHYPLLANVQRYGVDRDKTRSHIYVYINAAYEVQKELAALNQTSKAA